MAEKNFLSKQWYFDNDVADALYKYFIGIIQDDLGLDFSNASTAKEYSSVIEKVRDAAEKAKTTLNKEKICQVHLPKLVKNYDFEIELTREEFNDICKSVSDENFSRLVLNVSVINFDTQNHWKKFYEKLVAEQSEKISELEKKILQTKKSGGNNSEFVAELERKNDANEKKIQKLEAELQDFRFKVIYLQNYIKEH